MQSVRPKKSLGQHFLNDNSIAKRIADTLDGFPQLPVLEVGPGTGVLTRFLIDKDKNLTVVELDRESVAYLKSNFTDLEHERIIEADFLRLDLASLYDGQFCVIGNYPYNISSQIFFKVLDYRDAIPCCTGMIQKEVAIRIAADPGSKVYGILSVLLQAWYDVEYLFTVHENAFTPPPKVKSAVVRLVRNSRTAMNCNEKLFKAVVKTSFNRRRKMLRNSVKPLMGENTDVLQDPIFTKRPEQLSIAQFEEITNMIEPFIA
ncbi:MAG TPA: 16S rRNA (adenine(1518)-N(6)/adenine(1519)-N(6))-dimethyltransferase RsmA [Bacteroidales bacterium]|nr:16S rRNA (adenine(1518)-N(6)/adenine(1519)-N(6))-dimethyltransferase RsmA [Bacteroidales bacterium]